MATQRPLLRSARLLRGRTEVGTASAEDVATDPRS
jgi:hypothetical protein